MLEPIDDQNLHDHLTAFADGELDAAQSLAVWTYLADHPDKLAALRWLKDQQQLTVTARRALQSKTPDDVRQRILALTTPATDFTGVATSVAMSSPPIVSNTSRRRFIGYALTAAAGLAIGVTAAGYSLKPRATESVIPREWVVRVGRLHGECARLERSLHAATFEETDASLAALTKSDLGSETSAPDLTSIGFAYEGAGPCPASKFKTAHLLYRPLKKESVLAVSMFVQADAGQFPGVKIGRVYRVSSPMSPYPVLAWRTGKAVYFLSADEEKTVLAVLQKIRPTRDEDIVTVASK